MDEGKQDAPEAQFLKVYPFRQRPGTVARLHVNGEDTFICSETQRESIDVEGPLGCAKLDFQTITGGSPILGMECSESSSDHASQTGNFPPTLAKMEQHRKHALNSCFDPVFRHQPQPGGLNVVELRLNARVRLLLIRTFYPIP